MKEFVGRVVAPGTVTAPALVSHGGLNTLASFQKALQFGDKNATCGDQNNPDLYGRQMVGKALCLPQTIGSTTGGLVLYCACAMERQPACMLFSKPIDYSAIFASTDSNAIGIMKAADELHIDIPGRLSLIGFDNIPSTSLPRLELTTIEQPKRDMAVQAVDMLRDKIENGTQGYVHQILMPTLIKRSTCRALNKI